MGETNKIIIKMFGKTMTKSLKKTVIAARKKPNPNIKKYIINKTGMIINACTEIESPLQTSKINKKNKETRSGTIETKTDVIGSISVLNIMFLTRPELETIELDELRSPSLIANQGP
jgi:ribonucleotide reductase alpha subunit